jgi:hypothetical protein
MGFFKSLGNIVKKVSKPVKKVLKSPLGKAALLYGAYHFGPAAFQPGQGLRGLSGWQKALSSKAPWLYSADASGRSASTGILSSIGKFAKAHPYITAGAATATAGALASPKLEDKIDLDVDNPEAHQKYLTNRSMFEDEWADWLITKGDADTKEEALEMVRNNPMFSEGGRVKANIGLYAGPQGAMNQNMNPNMNQGLMSPNLGPRSMGMNPGAQQTDPRMAQMLQAQKLQGQAGAVPKASEDEELIQLIKMLSSMGVPMEQLRGRTKEELVEMLIAAQGRIKDSPDVKETADVIEEEEIREQEMAQGGRIGYRYGTRRNGNGDHPLHDDYWEEFDPDGDQQLASHEAIEMAGTDTPILELEDLPKLLEDFYEIFGRSPTSIDELKSWAANRTTEAPEEVVEEQVVEANTGGLMRTGYALGQPVIPSKDGMQLDMRDTGGYQPHGKAEKHDDVRALLAQGEFVMTSDAVKGMGGGDRELGAQKMYNLMHSMEAMA